MRCPFRNDLTPYLTPGRAREIATTELAFACHETLDYSQDDEQGGLITKKSMHCAGFLIMREKMDRQSQMMQIGQRFGFYDPSQLDMQAPIYADAEAMIEATR